MLRPWLFTLAFHGPLLWLGWHLPCPPWQQASKGAMLGKGLLCLAFMGAAVMVLEGAYGAMDLPSALQAERLRWSEMPAGERMAGGLLAVALAAPAEEWTFRGPLQKGLQASLGRWGAPMATSLLFALAHPNVPFHALTMGLVLASAVAKGVPLLSTSLAHALWNAGFLLTLPGRLP